MSEPIQPALTPEEWAKHHGGLTVDAGGDIYWGESRFMMSDDPDAIDIAPTLDHTRLHALAALCLYGQPFGFDATDVEMLRRDANAAERGDASRDYYTEGMQDTINAAAYRALADRIAALLPPASAPSSPRSTPPAP